MIRKIRVNELENYIGEEIVFSGFIDAIRDKKWVIFVILRDSVGKVQMTIEKSDENIQYFSHTAGKRLIWNMKQDLSTNTFLVLCTLLQCQKAVFVSHHCNWKSSLPSKPESDKTLIFLCNWEIDCLCWS